MNEKIKQLAEQAEGTKKHVPAVWQFYDHELEKFAELIIRECATAVNNVPLGYSDYHRSLEEAMRNDCVTAVYKYFGLNKE